MVVEATSCCPGVDGATFDVSRPRTDRSRTVAGGGPLQGHTADAARSETVCSASVMPLAHVAIDVRAAFGAIEKAGVVRWPREGLVDCPPDHDRCQLLGLEWDVES
jgi:hypothetical protein